MTQPADAARPAVHFTAEQGWINDPYGVSWTGDRYHLFFQAIPGRTTWAASCHWGHATSPDLVHWSEQPLALVPQPFELGCWSGSAVTDGPGDPLLFYTRVAGDDWRASVAVARPTDAPRGWRSAADDVVIDGPPAGVHAFRDPYVFRHGAEWIMITAAGFTDGSGGALQYRSADLRTWTYNGVLCSRASTPDDDVRTGELWECPQLFPLDDTGDRWVLLVSVWDSGVLRHVAAAVGSYDGRRFAADRWQRLTYGESAYAMSAFLDRDGRRCVVSWLRDEPTDGTPRVRAGAHSLAATITPDGSGRLVLRPHPDVDALRTRVAVHGDVAVAAGRAVDLVLADAAGCALAVHGPNDVRATLRVEAATVTVERPGASVSEVPADGPGLRVIVDADIVEVFTSAGYGAFRIGTPRADDPVRVALGGAGAADVEAYALEP